MEGWMTGLLSGVGGTAIVQWWNWWRSDARKDGKAEAEKQRIDERDHDVRADLRDLRDDFRTAINEFRQASTDMAKLQSSQNIVNAMSAKTIEALATKQDAHAEKIADHAATLRLLTDNVTMLRQRIDQVSTQK